MKSFSNLIYPPEKAVVESESENQDEIEPGFFTLKGSHVGLN